MFGLDREAHPQRNARCDLIVGARTVRGKTVETEVNGWFR
jgi:hypothetical protein